MTLSESKEGGVEVFHAALVLSRACNKLRPSSHR
jgi:hypothetical protein